MTYYNLPPTRFANEYNDFEKSLRALPAACPGNRGHGTPAMEHWPVNLWQAVPLSWRKRKIHEHSDSGVACRIGGLVDCSSPSKI